jgi:hypothetical protein
LAEQFLDAGDNLADPLRLFKNTRREFFRRQVGDDVEVVLLIQLISLRERKNTRDAIHQTTYDVDTEARTS